MSCGTSDVYYEQNPGNPTGVYEPLAGDELIVDNVTFSGSADECGAITGQRVTIRIPILCKAVWLTDCECKVVLSGAINQIDTFGLSRDASTERSYNFTMPSNSTSLSIKVYEVDPTFDNLEYDRTFSIANVSREERDACTPVVPPIDFSKIDTTFVAIGGLVGGVTGLVTEGREEMISFGLIGAAVATAYSYLTSTSQ